MRARRALRVDEPADFFDDSGLSLEPLAAPTVLVIGGPDELAAAVRRVAQHEGSGIVVERCDVAGVREAGARLRPFALVLSQEIYGFDPDALGALASELHAELVVLKVTRVREGFLDHVLRPSLRHALRRYRSTVQSGVVRR